MGAGEWRDFESWPPPGYEPARLHLHGGGALAAAPPAGEAGPDRYRYDPADPTPTVAGVRVFGKVGSADNRAVEARPDVLTYTSAPVTEQVEVIGEVGAEIWFRSSRAHADVFVRLCDVDESGRSWNVCDGLVSLSTADELGCARVELWPTAHRFAPGHRIRVQVASGAFPRFDRNRGAGEPRRTGSTLHTADQEVFHDAAHPSAIILPMRRSEG
jgi:hypothetical protein